MTQHTITELYQSAARKLKNDFDEAKKSIPHEGLKGQKGEDLLKEFLERRLPKRFGVSSGFIIDDKNSLSKQTDVILYDAENSPIIQPEENAIILHADNVAAIIEVKSTLDKSEIEDAARKISSVKKLQKTPVSHIDQPVTFSDLIVSDTLGIVFAYSSRTDIKTIAANLAEVNTKYPRSEWIDLIIILDQGIIGYFLQMPGEEGMKGQLMPPTSNDFPRPPCYVHLATVPEPEMALSRAFGVILSHLTFFRKRASLSLGALLAGSNRLTQSIESYWYDSAGELIKVPEGQIGEGPGPNWTFDVFISQTNQMVARIMQHNWADGVIYEIVPPSSDAVQLINFLAPPKYKNKIMIMTSQTVRGFTSLICGKKLSREEARDRMVTETNGTLNVRWYD